ncbi:tripartite tricarboxylate transporter TctB family protein [Arthrobacter zhaoguopingii]|uniref:tripartite tricarboxylate transporter TctB family protein n=1 Tax=Arthrobacter zhaoguopingii TaxID=2681491 RepID=UPI00135AFF5A|nr:tripartite tricarboxylate transporter TctB family protein [Arthrobacter zhaoguopingii]
MSTSTSSPAGSGTAAASGRPIGELVFALIVISVGVVGFVAGAGIQTPPSASDIGPKAFPYLVSGMLVLVGTGLVIQLLRGGTGVPEEGEDVDPNIATDWATVGKLAGFVLLHSFLIVPLGWPIAAAVLFFGAAWSLGARPWFRNLITAIILALVLQFVFAGLLGVSLPAGFLEGFGVFSG